MVTRCALLVRPRFYHGFHVLCNSDVPRLLANGSTIDCEQLREDDQHVLEHHQFHVSVLPFISSVMRKRKKIIFFHVVVEECQQIFRARTRYELARMPKRLKVVAGQSISRGVVAFE